MLDKFINIVKKHSFLITMVSISIAIFSVLMLINRTGALVYTGFCLCVYAWYLNEERRERQQSINQSYQIRHWYVRIAERLHTLLLEYSFLGLQLIDAGSIMCPEDYVRIQNDSFPIFRYELVLKDSFQTDLELFRKMLNERIKQELFYQPLYIVDVFSSAHNKVILIVVENGCKETNEFVMGMEQVKLMRKKKDVDTKAEDF